MTPVKSTHRKYVPGASRGPRSTPERQTPADHSGSTGVVGGGPGRALRWREGSITGPGFSARQVPGGRSDQGYLTCLHCTTPNPGKRRYAAALCHKSIARGYPIPPEVMAERAEA